MPLHPDLDPDCELTVADLEYGRAIMLNVDLKPSAASPVELLAAKLMRYYEAAQQDLSEFVDETGQVERDQKTKDTEREQATRKLVKRLDKATTAFYKLVEEVEAVTAELEG